MIYDASNALHCEQARMRLERLIKGGGFFELKAKDTSRTRSQNSYLHVAIAYLALQLGERADYVKRAYFKTAANADIFIRDKDDEVLGRTVKVLRSTADLSKEEMSEAIDRFLRWAADVAGVYIPSPEDHVRVMAMEAEVENEKKWR